jgi:hypothetical protein
MRIDDKRVFKFLDQIILHLRAESFPEEADLLHEIIYEVSWATSSEFYGELGLAVKRILSITEGEISDDLNANLNLILKKVIPV